MTEGRRGARPASSPSCRRVASVRLQAPKGKTLAPRPGNLRGRINR
jgi:hypothetical protein